MRIHIRRAYLHTLTHTHVLWHLGLWPSGQHGVLHQLKWSVVSNHQVTVTSDEGCFFRMKNDRSQINISWVFPHFHEIDENVVNNGYDHIQGAKCPLGLQNPWDVLSVSVKHYCCFSLQFSLVTFSNPWAHPRVPPLIPGLIWRHLL